MEKAKFYLIITIVLLLGTVFLNYTKDSRSTIDFDKSKFRIENPGALDRIIMESSEEEIIFENTEEGWYVNGSYRMDESLRMVFFRMMSEVEIRRPVAAARQSALKSQLLNEGTLVTFFIQGEVVRSFYVDAAGSTDRTYFSPKDEETAYIMEIPGYNQNIAAIFALTSLQWKDRKVFETSWQSLSTLRINYTKSERDDLIVKYEDTFPDIQGLNMEALDSARFMNYLDQFAYFETNEHIRLKDFDRFDSLSQTDPQAIITVEDIDRTNSNELRVFPQLPQSTVRLVQEQNGDWSVVEAGRMDRLLMSPEDFIRDENGTRL